jgi:putative ABC transport system permease protein
MLKSYLKVALRNISRTKLFSLINITGLAIGIAGTLMILMYVANELSYENFHKNRKQIYRVSVEFGEKGSTMKFPGAMPALAPALLEEAPDVVNAVRFERDDHATLEYNQKKFNEQNFFFADPSVFDVFSFTMMRGSTKEALIDPFSTVITKNMAQKYFGQDDPIGKSILYNTKYPLKITGIIENIPANTHLKCDFMVSYSSLKPMGKAPERPWNVFGDTYVYLLIRKGTSLKNLEQQIHSLLQKNTSENFAKIINFSLMRLSDIHLKSETIVDLAPRGNLTYVYVFSSVAALVLLIACFNFMNLSTARSLKRIKEVGMRKVLGARRSQLIKQFLGESLIITLLAVILAFVLFELFYPILNSFLENRLSISQQNFKYLFLLVPLVILIVGILAGSYPAFYLSRYQPIQAMTDRSAPFPSKSVFRKILVIAQFTMAIILIIGTMIIFKQLDFMKNSDLGFKKQNVVLINFQPRNPNFKGKYPVLMNQFKQYPQIVSVSGAYTVPGRFSKETKTIQRETETGIERFSIQAIAVDYDYVDSMGMEVVQGRNFSRKMLTDEKSAILLNQEAVKMFNLAQPIGEKFMVPGREGPKEMTVIGVVKDFHVYSLKQKIEALMLYINPDYFFSIAVRIHPENAQKTVAFLEKTWKDIFPDSPFDYIFLEDAYHRLYISEEKISQLLTLFSGLAVFVACLGLFGLASYMAEQRHKEIGIRKVLGADISGILLLLSKDFTKSVLMANVIAWPVAYYAMNKWLQNYAYRISLGLWMFVAAGLLILAISLFTVSYQALKAALANPVDSIRYE